MKTKRLFRPLTVLGLSALLLLGGTQLIASAETPETDATVAVTITADATLINITITPGSISINPNTSTVTKVNPIIRNNTTAPVSVVASGLTADTTAITLVSPSTHDAEDWSLLTKADSKDVAILMSISTDAGWKAVTNAYISTGEPGALTGTLAPDGVGTLVIDDVLHGNSFSSSMVSTLTISLTISLE